MRGVERLVTTRRKHRFVYCYVIAGTCFDVTVLEWSKYATILIYIIVVAIVFDCIHCV
jgi:uncharacterized protein YqiB (DUF1249 family)